MNAREFFNKVALLRHHQKDYFATRSRDALLASKALEKEIDAEIERVNRLLASNQQAGTTKEEPCNSCKFNSTNCDKAECDSYSLYHNVKH